MSDQLTGAIFEALALAKSRQQLPNDGPFLNGSMSLFGIEMFLQEQYDIRLSHSELMAVLMRLERANKVKADDVYKEHWRVSQ